MDTVFALLLVSSATSLGVFVSSTTCLGGNDEKSVGKRLALFEGTWRFRKIEADVPDGGALAPESEIQKACLLFKGNTYTWILPDGKADPEKFDLPGDQSRKWIDITKTVREIRTDGGQPQIQTWKLCGIYELTGDQLKICMPIMPAGPNVRPQEFTARPGSGCVVWVLERQKK